jgi:hypothetical protein
MDDPTERPTVFGVSIRFDRSLGLGIQQACPVPALDRFGFLELLVVFQASTSSDAL